jgi:3-methyladenine DNA glycosylase Tag
MKDNKIHCIGNGVGKEFYAIYQEMNFVGSTIIYAFMQDVGMVNDHLPECWLYQKNKY